jgi:hypothetical protein
MILVGICLRRNKNRGNFELLLWGIPWGGKSLLKKYSLGQTEFLLPCGHTLKVMFLI